MSSENDVTQSTEARPSSTRIRLSTSFTGRPLPLSRSADALSLTAITRAVAKATRLVQVAHMTGVQDVEATVGKDDLVTSATRGGDGGDKRFAVEYSMFDRRLSGNGSIDFGGGHRCGADPRAHQSGGEIGHASAVKHAPAQAAATPRAAATVSPAPVTS